MKTPLPRLLAGLLIFAATASFAQQGNRLPERPAADRPDSTQPAPAGKASPTDSPKKVYTDIRPDPAGDASRSRPAGNGATGGARPVAPPYSNPPP